jgi:magnesium transporter
VYTGIYTDVKVEADVMDYGPDRVEERQGVPFSEVLHCRDSKSVTWLDLRGLHDAAAIAAVGEHFGVHPLAVEDALSADGRTKVDDYGDVLFVTVKMTDLEPGASPARVRVEHVAFALGPTWVLSFQELPGDVFDPVRRRIRTGAGKIRKMPAAYLLHALLDAIVDGYFVVLSALQDELDRLEDQALAGAKPDLPRQIHELRGEIHTLRRAVAPLRYAAGDLVRQEARRIDPEVRPYLRDLLDHLEQVHDELESARERLVGVLELHLATNSHRMNDVMRGLTVVATVFIPLTFVAGVYGMNFGWMPETRVWWGYPAVLTLMGALGGAMVWWMKRRGWLG